MVDGQNGKIGLVCPIGFHLIPEHNRLHPFITFPTVTSVPHMKFQTTPMGTTPPTAESTGVIRTLESHTFDTLAVTTEVYLLPFMRVIGSCKMASFGAS